MNDQNDAGKKNLKTKKQGVQSKVDRDDQSTLDVSSTNKPAHDQRELLQVVGQSFDSFDNILDNLRQDCSDLVQVVGGTLSSSKFDSFGDSTHSSLEVDTDGVSAQSAVGDVDRVENVVEVDLGIVGSEGLGGVAFVDESDGLFLFVREVIQG